jgi:MFS family permease
MSKKQTGVEPSATTDKLWGPLSLFFIVSYIAHGIASQFGLIAQPVQNYLKQVLHMNAAEVSGCMALMMLPWVLKPFYGILCDFVPLFGYRRKSYLILANLTAAAGCTVLALSTSLPLIVGGFLCTALGVAGSTAVAVGLAVEAGRGSLQSRSYFSQQTIAYYSALVVSAAVGGVLCFRMEPTAALHTAAFIAIVPCLLTSAAALLMVSETKVQRSVGKLDEVWSSLKSALRTRPIWLAVVFIWLWDFSPSFGVPLYFYETNTLGYSQEFIGILYALNSVGMVIGALAYRYALQARSVRSQLYVAVLLGIVSTGGYLLLGSATSAVVLEVFRGIANMIAVLGIYALAADACPKGAEVSVMATLIAVRSLAIEAATYAGGLLFTHAFSNQLEPLVIVATVVTGLCILVVPFLRSAQHE